MGEYCSASLPATLLLSLQFLGMCSPRGGCYRQAEGLLPASFRWLSECLVVKAGSGGRVGVCSEGCRNALISSLLRMEVQRMDQALPAEVSLHAGCIMSPRWRVGGSSEGGYR